MISMNRFFVLIILWMQILTHEVETAACGGAIRSHYGEITSPNYPSNYPFNKNCVWNITGPPGSRIMLHFVDFQVAQSKTCNTDFVQMYFDANSTDRLCGGLNRWNTWLTKANRFNIFFKSGHGRNTERGFRLLWKGVGTTFLTSSNVTLSQAQKMCSEKGGTMLTDDTYIELSKEDLASQMDAAKVTEAWIGRYYTPWSWIKGCYTYKEGIFPGRAAKLKFNQQSACIEYCSGSNYFGLKGHTCVCFQKLEGKFEMSTDKCNYSCPGDTAERCGGNTAMTVYMNDLCFNNSSLWNGTISTSRSGETCLLQNSSGNQSFSNESVDNTVSFCRDPTNKGNTWCITSNGSKDCDIPKCLGKTDNNGAFGCMAFKEISLSRMQAQQMNCSNELKAVCQNQVKTGSTKDVTWDKGREICRSTVSVGKDINRMADTRYGFPDSGHYYWVGYRRTVMTVSDLSGSFTDCFRVTRNENGCSLTVDKCTVGIRAICQTLPLTCGETYNKGIGGKFSFPNTPRLYDSNHNCVWKIMATPPDKIEIYIDFDLEDSVLCMCDKIKIFDNDALNEQPNKTFCGQGNLTFISSGPTVVIQFISDESVNGTGFNVSWKIEKEEPTTILPTTTVQVWFIPAVSSGAVVFVVLITTLICFLRRHKRPREDVKQENVFTNSAYTEFDKNETITTGNKVHGSPIHSDSDRLHDTIDTYTTVQEPSDFISSDNKTRIQPQIAANISQNDDYTHDDYNSLNATFSKSHSNQTDNVYNHIPNDANEYSVSITFNAKPMNTQNKGTDNVYNTLPRTKEQLYDHADLSGIPKNRTENENDETYNMLPRTTDNEYDSTCSHKRVADYGEYNYISK